MEKEQVLTKLNERLSKRGFKATIVHFDPVLKHCEILITDRVNYMVATMSLSFDNDEFNVYSGNVCQLPNQFVDAFNLIEKGEY